MHNIAHVSIIMIEILSTLENGGWLRKLLQILKISLFAFSRKKSLSLLRTGYLIKISIHDEQFLPVIATCMRIT